MPLPPRPRALWTSSAEPAHHQLRAWFWTAPLVSPLRSRPLPAHVASLSLTHHSCSCQHPSAPTSMPAAPSLRYLRPLPRKVTQLPLYYLSQPRASPSPFPTLSCFHHSLPSSCFHQARTPLELKLQASAVKLPQHSGCSHGALSFLFVSPRVLGS